MIRFDTPGRLREVGLASCDTRETGVICSDRALHSGGSTRRTMMWTINVALLLALAACKGALKEEKPMEQAEAEAAPAPVDEDWIECAINGAPDFTRVCSVERSRASSGLILTMRHPDGGFRRLRAVEDGRGVLAADGAEPAQVTLLRQDEVEVTIGNDHYRLPATVRDVGQ